MSQNIIKHKPGLLNLAQEPGNISKACQVMGLSRDTFYRYQNAVQQEGVRSKYPMSFFQLIPQRQCCNPMKVTQTSARR